MVQRLRYIYMSLKCDIEGPKMLLFCDTNNGRIIHACSPCSSCAAVSEIIKNGTDIVLVLLNHDIDSLIQKRGIGYGNMD